MIKPMKLKGFLRLNQDRSILFEGNLYDGSSFSITPTQHDYELSEEFMPKKLRVPGWLYVQQESQQGDRVYVTLPKPSLQHGHHVLVRDLQLMPRSVSLADFRPEKKKAAEKPAASKENQDSPDE